VDRRSGPAREDFAQCRFVAAAEARFRLLLPSPADPKQHSTRAKTVAARRLNLREGRRLGGEDADRS